MTLCWEYLSERPFLGSALFGGVGLYVFKDKSYALCVKL